MNGWIVKAIVTEARREKWVTISTTEWIGILVWTLFCVRTPKNRLRVTSVKIKERKKEEEETVNCGEVCQLQVNYPDKEKTWSVWKEKKKKKKVKFAEVGENEMRWRREKKISTMLMAVVKREEEKKETVGTFHVWVEGENEKLLMVEQVMQEGCHWSDIIRCHSNCISVSVMSASLMQGETIWGWKVQV